jgi:hypothetical protein
VVDVEVIETFTAVASKSSARVYPVRLTLVGVPAALPSPLSVGLQDQQKQSEHKRKPVTCHDESARTVRKRRREGRPVCNDDLAQNMSSMFMHVCMRVCVRTSG